MMRKPLEIIRPLRLKVWGWHAVVNFFLGGIASGMYLFSLFSRIMGDSGSVVPLTVKLLPPILAGLGFFIVSFEAGHPSRAPYLLFNLRSSWMAREIIIGGLFIVSGAIDALFHSPFCAALTAAAALGLIVSQGFIVYRSVAVRAWNISLIPVFFLTSGLWSGFGLMLIAYSLTGRIPVRPVLSAGLVLAPADFFVWIAYLKLRGNNVSGKAYGHLPLSMILTLTEVIGYLIPMAAIVILMTATEAEIHIALIHIFAFAAGLSALTGNLLQKTEIILGDNFLRGIVMGQPKGSRQRE